GVIDVHYVDVREGRLTGTGTIRTGSGPIDGQVENIGGVVAPGYGIGVLEIEGRYSNGVGSVLSIDLRGSVAGVDYDQVLVDGPVTLNGILRVALVDQFVPSLGDVFSILVHTEQGAGEFAELQLPDLPPDRSWHVAYEIGGVDLIVAGQGDFNVDGRVDQDDLAAWEDAFGQTYAGGDFLNWQRRFGGGASNTSVPEPPASAVALLAIASWLTRRVSSQRARSEACRRLG
ncbi:MAG: hypothetical protein AAF961_08950, partial [Planctomycetota bacterium]